MAGQIKGITIEFKGDTTSLDKALRKIKTDSKSVDTALQKVNNALKFNPKNSELLAQKQRLLKQKVDQTAESLKELKDIQKKLDDDESVDKTSAEYENLKTEIVMAESKLKHFKSELAKVTAQNTKLYKMGDAWEKAGKKIEGAGRKLAPVSKAAGAITAAFGAITYKASGTADDINTLSKQTGISTDDLQKYAAAADLTDVSLEAMAKSQQTLKKNMFSASEGKSQKKYFDELGISVVDADGNLRDSNEVFNETIAALGSIENETQRDAIAMKIFGKSANELNPIIEDGGETYEKVSKMLEEHGLEPVSKEELDKANEFKDQIDTIKLVFSQAILKIGTKIATYLVPIMSKVVDVATKIASKIASLKGKSLAKIMGASGALTALSPVLIVVGKLVTGFGNLAKKVALLSAKFPKLAKAMKFLRANPILLVVAAFAALALAIKKTGLSSKDISKKITDVVNKVVKILPKIVDAVIDVIMDVVDALVDSLPDILDGAITLFMGLVDALPVILPKLLAAIAKLIAAVVKALPDLAKSLLTAVESIAKSAWTLVKAVFAKIKDWFKGKFGEAVAGIKEGFTGVASWFGERWTAIKGKFAKVKEFFKDKFTGAVKGIKEGFTGVATWFTERWTAIKDVFGKVKEFFTSKFTGAVSGIKAGFTGTKTWFTERWTAIKNVFEKVKEFFETKFGGAWSAIKNKFKGWGDFWSGLWTKVKNKFKSIGTSISTAISDGVRTGINNMLSGLESKLNHVVVTVNKIIKFVNDHSPLNIPTLGAIQLPRLAKGGIVDSATLALIGEGQSSEAVIPLDELWKRLDKMTDSITGAGGGSPIVVNVYGAEGQSVQSLANAVRRVLIEEEQRRRLAWQ